MQNARTVLTYSADFTLLYLSVYYMQTEIVILVFINILHRSEFLMLSKTQYGGTGSATIDEVIKDEIPTKPMEECV